VRSWVCYAESSDGIHWIKPNLGLVEFHGNRNNNIIAIEPVEHTASPADRNLHVLYEPDDPNPARRYKMMLLVPHEGGRWTVVPLFSADGLRWRYAIPAELTDEPKRMFRLSSIVMPNEHLEGGGLVRFGGLYYQNGQAENLYDGSKAGRFAAGYWSPDFIHWHPEKAESFLRSGFDPKVPQSEGRETHEGVALWNRGNVLVGVYGIWRGAKTWAGRRVDLGLVTSVDAIHYREPIPDFVFAEAGPPDAWDANGLLQGQGFEQIGDETYIWHGSWDLQAAGNSRAFTEAGILARKGEVGLLKLRRDGFGYVSVLDPRTARAQETFRTGVGSLMTVPFEITGPGARLEANAELVAEGGIRFELLDRAGMPVPGHSAAIDRSGVRVPVSWKTNALIRPGTYRLRATIDRRGAESPKLYAFYVTAPAVAARKADRRH
jgi:hypothetical protein